MLVNVWGTDMQVVICQGAAGSMNVMIELSSQAPHEPWPDVKSSSRLHGLPRMHACHSFCLKMNNETQVQELLAQPPPEQQEQRAKEVR